MTFLCDFTPSTLLNAWMFHYLLNYKEWNQNENIKKKRVSFVHCHYFILCKIKYSKSMLMTTTYFSWQLVLIFLSRYYFHFVCYTNTFVAPLSTVESYLFVWFNDWFLLGASQDSLIFQFELLFSHWEIESKMCTCSKHDVFIA